MDWERRSAVTLYGYGIAERTPMQIWALIAGVLVCGYGFWGRTFAYIGIRAVNLFIGDIVLGLFLLLSGAEIFRPWLANLVRPLPFSKLYWGMFFFLSYGFLQLSRGLELGYPPVVALQNLVFNVYPLYFFLGLWAALSIPDLLHKLVRLLSVASAAYGLLYYLFLRHFRLALPGTDLPLIVTPSGSMALIGLPCFERNLRPWWPVLCVSTFLVLAAQVRGEWLALMIALTAGAALMRKLRHLLWTVAAVGSLLVIGFVLDFSIPSPAGRGGSISSSEIVARAIAPFSRDTALEYSRKNTSMYAGTASWRTTWWSVIWRSVHSQTETTVLGYGYGYPLHDLMTELRGTDVRTPHNIFFYCLGYSGWIGVALFYTFQGALGLLMLRVWRANGQPMGLMLWLGALVGGHFGNLYETPFGAIPFYLMTGMAAAPLTGHTKESIYAVPFARTGVPTFR
jgi:hypothetical protein